MTSEKSYMHFASEPPPAPLPPNTDKASPEAEAYRIKKMAYGLYQRSDVHNFTLPPGTEILFPYEKENAGYMEGIREGDLEIELDESRIRLKAIVQDGKILYKGEGYPTLQDLAAKNHKPLSDLFGPRLERHSQFARIKLPNTSVWITLKNHAERCVTQANAVAAMQEIVACGGDSGAAAGPQANLPGQWPADSFGAAIMAEMPDLMPRDYHHVPDEMVPHDTRQFTLPADTKIFLSETKVAIVKDGSIELEGVPYPDLNSFADKFHITATQRYAPARETAHGAVWIQLPGQERKTLAAFIAEQPASAADKFDTTTQRYVSARGTPEGIEWVQLPGQERKTLAACIAEQPASTLGRAAAEVSSLAIPEKARPPSIKTKLGEIEYGELIYARANEGKKPIEGKARDALRIPPAIIATCIDEGEAKVYHSGEITVFVFSSGKAPSGHQRLRVCVDTRKDKTPTILRCDDCSGQSLNKTLRTLRQLRLS
jgi:hypothetical protein